MRQPVRVFLGGEGPNELGGWYVESEYRRYRATDSDRGILEALLRRLRHDGVRIVGALPWRKIPKFRAGDHADVEQRNILGLAERARRAGAEVVAFVRDTDGVAARARAIEAGIRRAIEEFEGAPRIAGGPAVPMIEAWILSLAGRVDAQTMSRTKLEAAIGALGLKSKGTVGFVGVIERADLSSVPKDTSLRTWLDRAEQALGPA